MQTHGLAQQSIILPSLYTMRYVSRLQRGAKRARTRTQFTQPKKLIVAHQTRYYSTILYATEYVHRTFSNDHVHDYIT